ncbi:MAG: chemotaxis protein CheW, partial [Phycisphaerae bacterium]
MKKILAFEVGGRDFGICTDRLREVVPHRAVTSVPGVPDFLLGVISLRHEVIPIVDLRALFDGQPTDMDATTCLVIAMHRSHDGNLTPVGLVARKVQNTHRIDERDLEDPPAIGGHRQTQSVHGLARTDDGLKIVLDIDRMFGEHRDALQAALDQDCSRQAGSPDATLSHGKSGENHPTARPKASNNRRIKLLSVWVANVEYAFPL